jgi:hypothetical protein
MRNQLQSKYKIMSWVLTATYALFWLSWSAHHLLAAEHHHETKVCRHGAHEQHLHSEEYAADDCSICQLAPTLATLDPCTLPVFHFPELIPASNNFGETLLFPVAPFHIFQPRAPPLHCA